MEIHFKTCSMLPNIKLGIGPVLSNNSDIIKRDKQGTQFGSVEPEIPLHVPHEDKHLCFLLNTRWKTGGHKKSTRRYHPTYETIVMFPKKRVVLLFLLFYCFFLQFTPLCQEILLSLL